MKTLLHVNYHEGPGKIEELFAIAKRFGYDGVELRAKYKFADMGQEEYQEKIGRLRRKYPDMEIAFGHSISICRGNPGETETLLKEYFSFMEWAHEVCSTKILNFFTGVVSVPGVSVSMETQGSGIALESDYVKSAAALKRIGKKAAALGMLVALETHNAYIHDLAKGAKKLLDMTDCESVGANYDHGNIALNRNGEGIAEVFSILGDKIYYAHLKNVLVPAGGNGFMITRLADGQINQREVMEGLKKHLKSGIFALEYPSKGDGVYAAMKDMEYVKFLKGEIGIE